MKKIYNKKWTISLWLPPKVISAMKNRKTPPFSNLTVVVDSDANLVIECLPAGRKKYYLNGKEVE